MRENLPVFSHRGAAHSAAPLLIFPRFGFSKYLLPATLADVMSALSVAGGTPATRATLPKSHSSWV
jgi:hypothetical protein